jgi:hypothetical protein
MAFFKIDILGIVTKCIWVGTWSKRNNMFVKESKIAVFVLGTEQVGWSSNSSDWFGKFLVLVSGAWTILKESSYFSLPSDKCYDSTRS